MLLLVLIGPASEATAATLRYAIVVGANRAVDPSEGVLPDLMHPASEAVTVAKTLRTRGRFEQERLIVLSDPTSSAVRAAIETIAGQVAADKQRYGAMTRSLFAFFYTGHGLRGRLVLRDGPISAVELGQLVRSVAATFTVGLFDSCFSGSVADSALLMKGGVRPTPGFNPLTDFPGEVLDATGSFWLVSSGPNQSSYEDPELGGVFTHYFIEAMIEADPNNPVTLDQIYVYARTRTIEHTAARRRLQEPEIYVRMAGKSPVYFALPSERPAKLGLRAAIEGQFVLSYLDGAYSETIDKSAGVDLDVAVYSGRARLRRQSRNPDVHAPVGDGIDVELKPRTTTWIDVIPEAGRSGAGPDLALNRKGEPALHVAQVDELLWENVGLSYDLTIAPRGVLTPRHTLYAVVRVGTLPFLEARLGGGGDKRAYEAWSYSVWAVSGEVRSGGAFEIWRGLWLAGGATLGARLLEQSFGDASSRVAWEARAGVVAEAGWRLYGVNFAVSGQLGVLNAVGERAGSERFWASFGAISVGAGLAF